MAHYWEVEGTRFAVPSDFSPTVTYTVTVRPDTKNGGTYLHCDCPAWPRSVAKGGCKHVIRVRGGRAASDEDILAAAKLLAWSA